jgi:restriction endonuclease fold toxin 9 of polymorphic toxin system
VPVRIWWSDAKDLKPCDELKVASQGKVLVAKVRSYSGAKEMRDLTVDDIHTYYVLAGTTPVLVHNCNTNLKPGNSPAAANGTAIHNGPEWQEHLDSLGYTRGSQVSPGNIPDGLTDTGAPIELKPNTRSGIKAGTRQLRRYQRAMGRTDGQLWVYDVGPDGPAFSLKAVPRSMSRWFRW